MRTGDAGQRQHYQEGRRKARETGENFYYKTMARRFEGWLRARDKERELEEILGRLSVEPEKKARRPVGFR